MFSNVKQIHILHRIGMIHCDIKSSNIMIDPKTLNVHIIDFGIKLLLIKNKRKNIWFMDLLKNILISRI